jgi:hypothetical protein
MQRLDGEIWLTVDELTDVGIDENTALMGIKRNSPRWRAIPDPEDRRRRLVRYDKLAGQYQQAVKAGLCGGLEPWEWIELKKNEGQRSEKEERTLTLLDMVEKVCEDGYKLRLGLWPGATLRQQRCLARAAGVVQVLADWYRMHEGGNWRTYEPVVQVGAWLSQKKVRKDYFYQKYLPTNPARLKEKVVAYALKKQPIEQVIYVPRKGNAGPHSKLRDAWWESVALNLKLSGRLQNDRACYRRVVNLAPAWGKGCPSESTLTAFLRKTRLLTAEKQYDLNNKLRQRHRSSAPLARAEAADDCWEMDGTRAQLVGHVVKDADGKPLRDKRGKIVTKSLYQVAVRDVYSGAYLGYWYGYAESEHAYRSALKMAVEVTGRLPVELRYDSFPGSNSKGWEYLAGGVGGDGLPYEGALTRAGVRLTCTSSATGKAAAERGFYTLQQVFEGEHAAYLGQGIRAGTANARPTEVYIARAWKQLLQGGWDYDQAWMAHAEIMATYNDTPYSAYSKRYKDIEQSPWDRYQDGQEGSEGKAVGAGEVALLFWEARLVGVRQNCIEFVVRGERKRYDIPAEEFDTILYPYQQPGVQLTVRHDPWDYRTVLVFSPQGELLAELTEQKAIQLHGKNPQYKELSDWKKNDKAIKERKAAKLSEYALSDEMAAGLATIATKAEHNDALGAWATQNAGTWSEPKKGKSVPLLADLEEVDFNPDDILRKY